MSLAPAQRSWFQFSLQRLMVAMLCASVCFATAAQLVLGAKHHAVGVPFGWCLLSCSVVSGCLAIGVLVKKAPLAAFIGVLVALKLWATAQDVFWH